MAKKNQKLPREQVRLICDFCLFLSLEGYFQDIAYESPGFLNLWRKVGRLNPDLSQRIQQGSDIEVRKLLRKIPRAFLDSKVIMEYDGQKNAVVISDGVFWISFSARFNGKQVTVSCFGFDQVSE